LAKVDKFYSKLGTYIFFYKSNFEKYMFISLQQIQIISFTRGEEHKRILTSFNEIFPALKSLK